MNRNQYKEARKSKKSAGRQAAAALLNETLARAAQNWASAGVAAKQFAHAAQDFYHLLQATVLPLKVLDNQTPQRAQELAQVFLTLAAVFEKKTPEAVEGVQDWESHLLLQAAATAAKPNGTNALLPSVKLCRKMWKRSCSADRSQTKTGSSTSFSSSLPQFGSHLYIEDNDCDVDFYCLWKRTQLLPAPAPPPDQEPTSDFDALLARLLPMDVSACLAYLRDHILLTNEDIFRRKAFVSRMEKVLNQHGLNCQLKIFGSTYNGLGVRDASDIDIFIEMKTSESNLSNAFVEEILKKTDFILIKDQSYLEKWMLGLGGNAEVCIDSKVFYNPKMRVPIISSQASGICSISQVDLNASNGLGIANTSLLHFLCTLEPRFHLLNVLLRFWAKKKTNLNRPNALSSYALSNLLLYFFQTRHPFPLLPPIDYLVRLNNGGGQAKFVKGYRCDFCCDTQRIKWRTKNRETAWQLLAAFFRFYANFDFAAYVIRTQWGKAQPLKSRKCPSDELQGEEDIWGFTGGQGRGRGRGRQSGKRRALVHLMDPFEKSHNLTEMMTKKNYDKMIAEFKFASEECAHYL
ncbi:Speckle targeted PIP5K1A-regulated poly(A) polymerase [Tyrophagus putrescentiae]|nr:Speckle targeted PIP5K1A-regulated poly(A) polymerase [Tyrophagus putrescentiae]